MIYNDTSDDSEYSEDDKLPLLFTSQLSVNIENPQLVQQQQEPFYPNVNFLIIRIIGLHNNNNTTTKVFTMYDAFSTFCLEEIKRVEPLDSLRSRLGNSISTSITTTTSTSSRIIWIDCEYLTTKELESLASTFTIHSKTVDEILDDHTSHVNNSFDVWKVYHTYIHIILNCSTNSSDHPNHNIHLLLLNQMIISIRNLNHNNNNNNNNNCTDNKYKNQQVKEQRRLIENVIDRVKELNNQIPSTEWVLYNLLDVIITDEYLPAVNTLVTQVDGLDEFNQCQSIQLLKQISQFNRRIVYIQRSLMPKQLLISSLENYLRPSRLYMTTDEEECISRLTTATDYAQFYLRDHMDRCSDNLKLAKKHLIQTNLNYTSRFHIHRSHLSRKSQSLAIWLTMWGAVWAPTSLLTAILGMNVKIPAQFSDSYLAFTCITCFTFLFSWVLFFVLNRIIPRIH